MKGQIFIYFCVDIIKKLKFFDCIIIIISQRRWHLIGMSLKVRGKGLQKSILPKAGMTGLVKPYNGSQNIIIIISQGHQHLIDMNLKVRGRGVGVCQRHFV